MRNNVKRLLIGTFFVVAMLGGGELPILHAPQFAEAHAFVHQHTADATQESHHDAATDSSASAAHDHADHEHDQSPGADRSCTHVHAHCCAATAILIAATLPSPAIAAGHLRLERNGAVPYGQLSHPPLRPPRLAA